MFMFCQTYVVGVNTNNTVQTLNSSEDLETETNNHIAKTFFLIRVSFPSGEFFRAQTIK